MAGGVVVRAKSRTTSAQVPLVMNILEPLTTQSAPSRTAFVVRFPASEPVPGSVSPKQPSASPEVSRGSQARFCSSSPQVARVLATSPSETETMPRTDESPRPSSSVTRQYVRWSPPEPPYSSGTVSPRKPSAPSLPTIARSTLSSRSQSTTKGVISRSTKSSASLRAASCSSLSPRSTADTPLISTASFWSPGLL